MRSIIVVCLLSVVAIQVNGQDISGIASSVFNNLLSSVVSQWGNMSSEDMTAFVDKLTQPGGLSHIWNAMDEHCGSHFDCGPEACCLEPNHSGKRAFTDSINLHTSSYCAPLKQLEQTCSFHHSGERTSKFSCPCGKGLKCVSGGSFSIHPLITLQKNSVCKTV